jgi:orotate phosphoribosyltransferase
MLSKSDIQKETLSLLINNGAFRVAPNLDELFVLKSGRKSPTFINTRALTDGESLSRLKRMLGYYIGFLMENKMIDNFDYIFGPSYNGIPISVLACEGLFEVYGVKKRYLYDRKEDKSYGDKKMDQVIVGAGYFKPGQKILMIDDVITTGETKVESIEKLKVLGDHKIVGMVLIVDRQEKAGDAENVIDEGPTQLMERQFGFKVFSILEMKTIFNLMKGGVSAEIRDYWTEYLNRYGTVRPDGK